MSRIGSHQPRYVATVRSPLERKVPAGAATAKEVAHDSDPALLQATEARGINFNLRPQEWLSSARRSGREIVYRYCDTDPPPRGGAPRGGPHTRSVARPTGRTAGCLPGAGVGLLNQSPVGAEGREVSREEGQRRENGVESKLRPSQQSSANCRPLSPRFSGRSHGRAVPPCVSRIGRFSRRAGGIWLSSLYTPRATARVALVLREHRLTTTRVSLWMWRRVPCSWDPGGRRGVGSSAEYGSPNNRCANGRSLKP